MAQSTTKFFTGLVRAIELISEMPPRHIPRPDGISRTALSAERATLQPVARLCTTVPVARRLGPDDLSRCSGGATARSAYDSGGKEAFSVRGVGLSPEDAYWPLKARRRIEPGGGGSRLRRDCSLPLGLICSIDPSRVAPG